MGNTLGRGGRRRRVLNEEIVAASGTHAAYRSVNASSSTAERSAHYGEAASVKHHARISDFVARKSGTIWVGWVAGMAFLASLVALDCYRERIAALAGVAMLSPLDLTAAGSLASWFSSVLLLIAAAHASYIYSLRRHKLGDYRGRYRVWAWAAGALVLLSVNAVTGLHVYFAAATAELVGWTALSNHAVWWLVSGVIAFGWIGYFTLRDAWESRLARLAYVVTLLLFATGLTGALSDVTQFGLAPEIASRVSPVAVLTGYLFLLTSLAAFARFVSLDAEGLLPDQKSVDGSAATLKAKEASQANANVTKTESAKGTFFRRSAATEDVSSAQVESLEAVRLGRTNRSQKSNSDWVDGRTPVNEDFYSDDDASSDRKLSKADRKRLRKIKSQQRRAA